MRRAANFAYYADEIWGVAHHFYQLKSYSQAKELYSQIYNRHTEHPRFLFEYAHTLHYLGEYDDSNKLLEAASTWSGDPMIWNVMGKNYQALGNYPEAERCYLRALHRVPSRIYPYYLLAKLYALPDYYHPISFKYYCNQVLNKKPKINSPAIEEMRSVIKRLHRNMR
jgi:tetratricopeptide (TPR) repeat protein